MSYLSFPPDAFGVSDIGVLGGLVAISMVRRIAGAITSRRRCGHLGYRRGMGFAVLPSAFACLGPALQPGAAALARTCLVFGFPDGYFQTVSAAIAMSLSDPGVAASMFAIFMVFLNIGMATGQWLGGLTDEAPGFGGPCRCRS